MMIYKTDLEKLVAGSGLGNHHLLFFIISLESVNCILGSNGLVVRFCHLCLRGELYRR